MMSFAKMGFGMDQNVGNVVVLRGALEKCRLPYTQLDAGFVTFVTQKILKISKINWVCPP